MKEQLSTASNRTDQKNRRNALTLFLAAVIAVGCCLPVNASALAQPVNTAAVSSAGVVPSSTRRALEIGTKTVPRSYYQRLAYVKQAFPFFDANGKVAMPDLSKIEYSDPVSKQWVKASEVKCYRITSLKNPVYLPFYNTVIVPDSQNQTDTQRLAYINSPFLPPVDVTMNDVVEITDASTRAAVLENKLREYAGRNKLKVDGNVFKAPALESFQIGFEDKKKFAELENLLDTKDSALYAGCGNERGDGVLGVYTTDLQAFRKSQAMAMILENDWHVIIREVPLSNRKLEAAQEKLGANAEKYGVTNIMKDGAANTLLVETSDISEANTQAIEALLGIGEIITHPIAPAKRD